MDPYNFFKFLKEKENREIPKEMEFYNKFSINPNYQITQEDIDELSISKQGFVNFFGSKIKSLPNLKYPNVTIIRCPNLKSLSPNSTFKSLYLSQTPITIIPPNLTIIDDLQVDSCPDLISISPGLKILSQRSIGSMLVMRDCPSLKSFPPNIKCSQIIIYGCPNLTSLPSGLEVDYLITDNIMSLPQDLKVKKEFTYVGADKEKIKQILPPGVTGKLTFKT